MGLENIENVLLILSGKGGVGKSSVTIQLALSLTQQGYNVGILDIDLTGPSIPRLLNLEDKKVRQAPGGWLPVKVHDAIIQQQSPQVSPSVEAGGVQIPIDDVPHATAHSRHPVMSKQSRGSLHALSLAFLLPSRSSAVIWRGPKKTAMIRQFVSDVLWPAGTDYLLIDTPPGTSDEHIAIVEELHKIATSTSTGGRLAGAVVVTTPQAVSTSDVRKELNFCVKTQVPVIGVIENMAGYMCPCCNEISNVFSKGGGEIMARECGVPFLGSVPIDTEFGSLVEGAQPESDEVKADNSNSNNNNNDGDDEDDTASKPKRLLVEAYEQCGLYPIFDNFAKKVVMTVANHTDGPLT